MNSKPRPNIFFASLNGGRSQQTFRQTTAIKLCSQSMHILLLFLHRIQIEAEEEVISNKYLKKITSPPLFIFTNAFLILIPWSFLWHSSTPTTSDYRLPSTWSEFPSWCKFTWKELLCCCRSWNRRRRRRERLSGKQSNFCIVPDRKFLNYCSSASGI